jgi:hypothetical protein
MEPELKNGTDTPKEEGTVNTTIRSPDDDEENGAEIVLAGTGESIQELDKAFRFAAYFSITSAIILLVLIPLPLFFSSHVFTKGGFKGWIAVSFVWVFYAICAVVVYPVVESRHALAKIGKAIWRDIRSVGGRKE